MLTSHACDVVLCAAEPSGVNGGERPALSPLPLQATCLHLGHYWGLYSAKAGVLNFSNIQPLGSAQLTVS